MIVLIYGNNCKLKLSNINNDYYLCCKMEIHVTYIKFKHLQTPVFTFDNDN